MSAAGTEEPVTVSQSKEPSADKAVEGGAKASSGAQVSCFTVACRRSFGATLLGIARQWM